MTGISLATPVPAWIKRTKIAEHPGGLECPRCGTTARTTIDSRPRKGTVFRRHICINGHRFSSIELRSDAAQLPHPLAASIEALRPADIAIVLALIEHLGHQ